MEIRTVVGEDGEVYFNGKDLSRVLVEEAHNSAFSTSSVLYFVRTVVLGLLLSAMKEAE